MPAAKYDFRSANEVFRDLEIGATFQRELRCKQNATDPADLTGFTARMQVRKIAGAALVLDLSTENGRIAIDGPDGRITLAVPAAETQGLPKGTHLYDIILTSPTGVVTRLIEGRFRIVPGVSE